MVDVEINRICDGTNTSWQFVAKSSRGQDFIEQELELQGTGSNEIKLVCNDTVDAMETEGRMLQDGLTLQFGGGL